MIEEVCELEGGGTMLEKKKTGAFLVAVTSQCLKIQLFSFIP